jgi:hypothetical protein
MARRSDALERLSKVQREALDADIMRGELSWRELEKKHGVPQATMRAHAERNGIVRNPTGIKRAMVEQLLAQPEDSAAARSARQSAQPAADETDLEKAAAEDARDMRLGLGAARIALSLVGAKLQKVYGTNGRDGDTSVDYSPRDLKTFSEAISINVDTIRRIRGLDAGVGIPDMTKLTDQELEDLRRGKMSRR